MLDASDVVSDGPVPSWDRPVVDMSRDTALTVVVLACGFECPSCGVWGSLRIRVVRWVVGPAGCRLESRWGGRHCRFSCRVHAGTRRRCIPSSCGCLIARRADTRARGALPAGICLCCGCVVARRAGSLSPAPACPICPRCDGYCRPVVFAHTSSRCAILKA